MGIYKASDIVLKLQQGISKHILKPLDKIISKFFFSFIKMQILDLLEIH